MIPQFFYRLPILPSPIDMICPRVLLLFFRNLDCSAWTWDETKSSKRDGEVEPLSFLGLTSLVEFVARENGGAHAAAAVIVAAPAAAAVVVVVVAAQQQQQQQQQ